jgi:hypothetical protein
MLEIEICIPSLGALGTRFLPISSLLPRALKRRLIYRFKQFCIKWALELGSERRRAAAAVQ